MPQFTRAPEHLRQKFDEVTARYGLPEGVLERMGWMESRWRPEIIAGKLKSAVGATGLMQFMPATAAEQGLADPTDPMASIEAAGKYLSGLLKQTGGDVAQAVAAYNWGIGNVKRRGLDNAPTETLNYIAGVLGEDAARPSGAGQPAAVDPVASLTSGDDPAAERRAASQRGAELAATAVQASNPGAAFAAFPQEQPDTTAYGVSTGEYLAGGLDESYTARAWDIGKSLFQADPNWSLQEQHRTQLTTFNDAEQNILLGARSQEDWDARVKRLTEDREVAKRGMFDSPWRAFAAGSAGSMADPLGMLLGAGVGTVLSAGGKAIRMARAVEDAAKAAKAADKAAKAAHGLRVTLATDLAEGAVFDFAAETTFQKLEGTEVDWYSVYAEVLGGGGFAVLGAGVHVGKNAGTYYTWGKEALQNKLSQFEFTAAALPRANKAAPSDAIVSPELHENLAASTAALDKVEPDGTAVRAAMGTTDGTEVPDTPITGALPTLDLSLLDSTAEAAPAKPVKAPFAELLPAPSALARLQQLLRVRADGEMISVQAILDNLDPDEEHTIKEGFLKYIGEGRLDDKGNPVEVKLQVFDTVRLLEQILATDIAAAVERSHTSSTRGQEAAMGTLVAKAQEATAAADAAKAAGRHAEEKAHRAVAKDLRMQAVQNNLVLGLAKVSKGHALRAEIEALLTRVRDTGHVTVVLHGAKGSSFVHSDLGPVVFMHTQHLQDPDTWKTGDTSSAQALTEKGGAFRGGVAIGTLVHELRHSVTAPVLNRFERLLELRSALANTKDATQAARLQSQIAQVENSIGPERLEALEVLNKQFEAFKAELERRKLPTKYVSMRADRDSGRTPSQGPVLGDLTYAAMDLHEFVSQTANSPEVIKILTSMPSVRGLKDALSDFIRSLLKLIGISEEHSAYTDVQYAYETLLRDQVQYLTGGPDSVLFAPEAQTAREAPDAGRWEWPTSEQKQGEQTKGRLEQGLSVDIFADEDGRRAEAGGLKTGDTEQARINRHTANVLQFFKDWQETVETNPLWQRAQERFRQWLKATGKELTLGDKSLITKHIGNVAQFLDSISQIGAQSKVPGVRAMIGVLADSANGANRFGATVSSYFTKANDSLVYGAMPKLNGYVEQYMRDAGASFARRAFGGGELEARFWTEVETLRQKRRLAILAGGPPAPAAQGTSQWVIQAADIMDQHAAQAVDLLAQSGLEHGLNIQAGTTVGYHTYEFVPGAIEEARRSAPERIRALAANLTRQFTEQFVAQSVIPKMLADPAGVVKEITESLQEKATALKEKYDRVMEQIPELQPALVARTQARAALGEVNALLGAAYARVRELNRQANAVQEAGQDGQAAQNALDTLLDLRLAHLKAAKALREHKEKHPGRVGGALNTARKALKEQNSAAWDALQAYRADLKARNELLAEDLSTIWDAVDSLQDEHLLVLEAATNAAAKVKFLEGLMPEEFVSPYRTLRMQLGRIEARIQELTADPQGYVQARVESMTKKIEAKAASRAQHYLEQQSMAAAERAPELTSLHAQIAEELLLERFEGMEVDAPLTERFAEGLKKALTDRSRREFDIVSEIEGVKLMDFMDLDGRRMVLGLSRDVAGAHALAKFGIRDEFHAAGVMEALRKQGASEQERSAVQTLLHFYQGRLNVGRSELAMGLRNLAYTLMMTKNALNLLADAGNVGHIAGMRGVAGMLSGMVTSFLRPSTWKRTQARERLTGVAAELAATLPGRVGDEFLTWANAQETTAGTFVADGGKGTRFTRALAYGSSHIFGAQLAARIVQENAFRIVANKLSEVAMGWQTLEPERLWDLGFTEKGWAAVQAEAQKHAQVVNGEIKALQLALWDPDARDLMLAAVQRAQAQVTSRMMSGESPEAYVSGDVAGIFYQFRLAGLTAAEKQGARSWVVGDSNALVAVTIGALQATVLYGAKTFLIAATMDDDRSEEFVRKRLQPETPAELFEAGMAWAVLYNPGGNLADLLQIGGVAVGQVRPDRLIGAPGVDALGTLMGIPGNAIKAGLADTPEERQQYLGATLRALPGLNAPLPAAAIQHVLSE